MIGAFKFNNVESSIFSLVCKSIKRPLLPAVKLRRIEPVGASGVYDFGINEHDMRRVTMRIAYIGTSYEELRTRARSIAAWLSVPTWSQLIINDEPDKYYLAKVTDEIDLASLWGSGTAEITFDCQPFAYSVTETVEEFTVDNTLVSHPFTNPGTREINCNSPQGSVFKIEISGTWTSVLSMSMNGDLLTFTQASSSGTLIIDNVEMTAMNGTANKYQYLGLDTDTFFRLVPGVNSFTINGAGTYNLTVRIRYVSLWL